MPAGLGDALAERVDYGFGASVIESGLFFLPSSLAMMLLGPFAGSLGSRLGPVVPLRIGIVSAGSGVALFALFHAEPWNVYASMALLGIGLAFAFASIGRLAVDNARPEETGVATGINTIMRTSGAAVGAQVAATIISASTLAGTSIPAEAGSPRIRDGRSGYAGGLRHDRGADPQGTTRSRERRRGAGARARKLTPASAPPAKPSQDFSEQGAGLPSAAWTQGPRWVATTGDSLAVPKRHSSPRAGFERPPLFGNLAFPFVLPFYLNFGALAFRVWLERRRHTGLERPLPVASADTSDKT